MPSRVEDRSLLVNREPLSDSSHRRHSDAVHEPAPAQIHDDVTTSFRSSTMTTLSRQRRVVRSRFAMDGGAAPGGRRERPVAQRLPVNA